MIIIEWHKNFVKLEKQPVIKNNLSFDRTAVTDVYATNSEQKPATHLSRGVF